MTTKLLIFGITGDLSQRKLLPALAEILRTKSAENLEIIGVSRREVDVKALIEEAVKQPEALLENTRVYTMDIADSAQYDDLKTYLALNDSDQLLVYLSVPPRAATQIVDFLGDAGLNTPNVKILFEKPFGVDEASAREVIGRTARYFSEQQIYRIDHYLAKEMAQNIVAFRAHNALFSHIWNNSAVEAIEIVAGEKIGIEGRGQFYEQTGALRDVVQGHLLQLLALVLMEVPDNFTWDQLPAQRLQALEQIMPAEPKKSIRAQYKGYREEIKSEKSSTETFVALELASKQPRWQGVPLRLITGKALAAKTTEIRVYLKKHHQQQRNTIIFHVQPNEGIEIELTIKKPGYDTAHETRRLGFSYPEDEQLPEAYEQVLVDAIRGRKNLFTEGEEVIRAWQILQPLQHAWSYDQAPLYTYKPGSALLDNPFDNSSGTLYIE
ncbi:hypothetical protein FJZ39_02385 [Candidatus Saccharibacteria bacterium]|nr:hypothetical protein [Candidatus Saccharibacteria bacterium]